MTIAGTESNVVVRDGLVRIHKKRRQILGLNYIDHGISVSPKDAFAKITADEK